MGDEGQSGWERPGWETDVPSSLLQQPSGVSIRGDDQANRFLDGETGPPGRRMTPRAGASGNHGLFSMGMSPNHFAGTDGDRAGCSVHSQSLFFDVPNYFKDQLLVCIGREMGLGWERAELDLHRLFEFLLPDFSATPSAGFA